MKKTKILSYRPSYIRKYGIGYAATSLTIGMNSNEIISDIFSMQSEYANDSAHVKQAFSRWKYKLLAKFLSPETLVKLVDRMFIKRMSDYDVAYLWPGCSIDVVKQLKKKHKRIIFEFVNCHQQVAKDILDKESALLGGIQTHAISAADIEDESAKLNLADFVFSPSPQVTASLIKMHFDKDKIIETSYGLDKSDLFDIKEQDVSKDEKGTITALFVGSVIPRKGIHLLLDYWKAAGVDGKLKVIGKVEPLAETIVNRYRDQTSIEFVSFTDDLATHYKNADVFILPSLEEGSPLVTYLAIGSGLPCLVSPMAGDGVIRDGLDGYILPTHDKDAWVNAIQKLAIDKSLRSKLAKSSRLRAEDFLWPKVAQARAAKILNKLGIN